MEPVPPVPSEGPLVSIVMPAYNSGMYIGEAIRSVLAQTHRNWELLVVNDGSTDATVEVLSGFDDPRIKIFHKTNGGIGSARNLGLRNATGRFLSFLDSDDLLPPKSLEARLQVLQAHPEADIADGCMTEKDHDLEHELRVYRPTFSGRPFHELVDLTGSCFGGVTWMVRWPVTPPLFFDEQATQMEDLMFWMAYSHPGREYRCTTETVLIYRRTSHSSTSDLSGMERSYRYVHRWLLNKGWVSLKDLERFRSRSRRIMIASWIHAGRPLKALRSLFLPFS